MKSKNISLKNLDLLSRHCARRERSVVCVMGAAHRGTRSEYWDGTRELAATYETCQELSPMRVARIYQPAVEHANVSGQSEGLNERLETAEDERDRANTLAEDPTSASAYTFGKFGVESYLPRGGAFED